MSLVQVLMRAPSLKKSGHSLKTRDRTFTWLKLSIQHIKTCFY